jgi:hypothetical protein
VTPLTFRATVHRVITDKDGEGKVTLTIPLSDLGAGLVLATRVNKLLKVTVEEIDETTQRP